jgi:ABC-type polysaccharide/polyol phosphate export permease
MTEKKLLAEWAQWALLGWFDILSRYRRTTFGPLWIALMTAMTVASIGFVYAALFKLPIKEFLPFVSIGIVIWNWISGSLLEAGTAFVAYKSVILNQVLHPTSVVVRVVIRNMIILLHNAVVVAVLFIVFDRPVSWTTLLVIPGLIAVGLIVLVAAVIAAFACTRFRDLNQVLTATVSLGFLITPVIWTPEVLGERAYIANLNPITHLLGLVRLPLLGTIPAMESWYVAAIMFVGLAIIAFCVVRKYRHHIPFWL